MDRVEFSAMCLEDLLQGVGQIVKERETIGNLNGTRGTLSDARRLGIGALARHDGDFGMGLEPGRYGVRLAIRKDVDGTAAL